MLNCLLPVVEDEPVVRIVEKRTAKINELVGKLRSQTAIAVVKHVHPATSYIGGLVHFYEPIHLVYQLVMYSPLNYHSLLMYAQTDK